MPPTDPAPVTLPAPADSSEVEIAAEHRVLLIDIALRFRHELTALELYEATRGAWHTGNRREQAQYAFAVAANVVREVYEIHSWHRAGSTPYRIRPFASFNVDGRWEFIGGRAPANIRQAYIGRSVSHYWTKGQQHGTLAYVHC